MRIGLMGGSFDPIHMGHLVLAQQIQEKLNLDQILFIPAGRPPHKQGLKQTDKEKRYEMVRLAIKGNPLFAVSRIEVDSNTINYTVETLRKIKAQSPIDTSYYFITGADAVVEMESWRGTEELLELCQFVGATRPGVPVEQLKRDVERLTKKYGPRIELVQISSIDLSSTEIRQKCSQGESVRYLVPDSVWAYIQNEQLYGYVEKAKV